MKIGRAGGKRSNRETPDQIGRVGISGNVLIGATLWCDSDMAFRDLSEISRGEGGKGILNLGSEMR